MKAAILIFMAGLFGALIGWLDPSRPEHMTVTMNIVAGIVSGIITLGFFALFLKEANERARINMLMHECYLGSSLQTTKKVQSQK